MKQKTTIKESGRKMRRAALALAGILAMPAWVMAQSLPTMPPAYSTTNIAGAWDQAGLYPAGAINTVTYYSSVYGANEQMMVYTPPGYNPSQKYGVIYCYQGISTGIDTIFDNWCVYAGTVADNLIGQGVIKPVIIVAVNDQINGDPTADTINCAIPYIDSHYSTYADADHRGLYGFSWGGMYCADIGCANLNTFHHLSPSSPAFFNSGQGPNLFPNGGAQAKQVLKCMLLSCGTSDWDGFYPASLDLANWCMANGIPNFYWFPVQGAGHDASVWSPAMWNFLQLADKAGISSGSTPQITGGACKLLARHSGKALDASGSGTTDGTQIIQWTYGGGANQQWTLNSVGNNQYSIIGVQSGKCIDISNWGTANGTKVQLWDYVGGSNQKYTFTATDSGYYEISPSHATNSCLDVSGVSTADGATVQLWAYGGGQNQQWLVQPVDGTVKLVARHSGKALDAYGAQTADGTQIIQWTYGSGANQQWTVTDTGSGNYKIIGVQSGKAADVSNGGTANGTKVQLWDYYGNTAQLYKFTGTDPGYFRITPNCATGSCLDVSGVSTADGANVQLWQWLSGANQQWAPQAP